VQGKSLPLLDRIKKKKIPIKIQSGFTIPIKKKAKVEIPNCSICYQLLDPIKSKIKTLSCHEKHQFHFSCIRRWEIISKQRQCPFCRVTYL